MDEFFTRASANEGVKLPLYLPNGTVTEHFFVVRGVDSDEFRVAESKAKRGAINIAQLDTEAERIDAIQQSERECIASLIASWSFDNPCTRPNVMAFLKEAPQIADAVNRFAARREGFMAKKPTSSSDG